MRGHTAHGDPRRFEVMASYIGSKYKGKVTLIADVEGGQGMLARMLKEKYDFICEVIDPRGITVEDVPCIQKEFTTKIAEEYDLIVALHPHDALKEVVWSAQIKPVVLLPCCDFWTEEQNLEGNQLLQKIEKFYVMNTIPFEKVNFNFEGPRNVGLVSEPEVGYLGK